MNQMFSAGALLCALASVVTFSMRPGLYLSQELVIRSDYPPTRISTMSNAGCLLKTILTVKHQF